RTSTKKTAATSNAPRYDANSPAVSSSPVPTTSSNLPSSAPTTYSTLPGTAPRSVDGAAAPTTYASAAAVAAPLVGAWINTSDPDETVQFTDHSYASFYEGQMITEEEMTYHPQCPGDCSGGQTLGVPCFIISSEYGTDCYGIIRVTETELELSIIGQSTETVKYTRLNP
ncbi:MAG: hypothetical protein AAFU67_00975, partial [Bacteroidota bacterium]